MAFDLNNITSMLEMLDVPVSYQNFSLEELLSVSKEYEADNRWFSRDEELVIIVLFSFLSVLGLLGNGLVFYIIARKGWKQSSRNWYILNLACSDILTCVMCKPLTVVRLILKNWVLGGALCKVVPSLQTMYVFVSTFTIVALAVDRYSSIIYNNHQTRFKRWVFVCLCFIWLVSLGVSVPMMVVHDIEHVKGFNGNVLYSLCLEKWQSETAITSYTVLMLLLQYLSPLIAIVVLHFLIGRFLRSRFQTTSPENISVRRKRRRHRKNILLLSSMAISFGVSWFPLHFINALATIDYSFFQGLDFPLIHAVCMMLAFSSVCLNPVIYGLLNTNFRRDLIKMCGGGHEQRFSVYTDFTRRSSPNPEQLGLISSTPIEMGISNTNLCRIRNGHSISAL
ncbi:neuropeptide Y receptor type 5-like [Aplysia californica]|uniref:Neuropeptide Y receptor type 5-like n=1 Tax=Aplysia californica TaxID=6500 RepID=A0ABM0JGD5_APLCA|nr:neuropeptide Y receptor type 5-like [Aplysia californica]